MDSKRNVVAPVKMLWDPGDISAPVGSPSWCRGIHNLACGDKKDGTTAVINLKGTLIRLRDKDHYRLLCDVEGAQFATWEDYVQYREPFGLGMRVDVVNAIMSEKDETRLLKDVIDSVPDLPQQEYGAGKAGPGRGKKTADDVSRLSHGNSTDYLAARIKRDHPEIAARISEFPSMRAAAREAGIVRDPPPLSTVQKAWRKASSDERDAIVRWITDQSST